MVEGVASIPLSRLVTALLVGLAGLALMVLGARGAPAELKPGSNRLITGERSGIDANNTPAVATDPTRPGVVVMANRVDTPQFSCSVSRSADGGRTWGPLTFPLPPGVPNCYWPDVAFDDQGRLLVLYTATGGPNNLPLSIWLQPFEGVNPMGPATRVSGPLAFHADLAVSTGRVLVTWVQAGPATVDRPVGFEPPHALMLARSLDGGRAFSAPIRVSEDARRVALPTVLAGPGDRVVVGALDLVDDALDYRALHDSQGGPPPEGRWQVVTWLSTDGGAAFSPASTVAELVIPQRIIVNLGPAPGFARDRAGSRLYATWDGGRGDQRDVFLARSDDGGLTWSRPVQVARRPRTQNLPAVDVAPDGRVDVVFYDRSREPDDVTTEVSVASSWDGGLSFTMVTASDRSFDSGIGFGSAQGIPVLGSRLAVLSQPERALAFWADTRRGTVDTNRQDLAVAPVDARRETGVRWPPVALGAVLLLAGSRLGLGAGVGLGAAKGSAVGSRQSQAAH